MSKGVLVEKSFANLLGHVVWCTECNSHLGDIRIHMIRVAQKECQYCKQATMRGLCKKHHAWVYGL